MSERISDINEADVNYRTAQILDNKKYGEEPSEEGFEQADRMLETLRNQDVDWNGLGVDLSNIDLRNTEEAKDSLNVILTALINSPDVGEPAREAAKTIRGSYGTRAVPLLALLSVIMLCGCSLGGGGTVRQGAAIEGNNGLQSGKEIALNSENNHIIDKSGFIRSEVLEKWMESHPQVEKIIIEKIDTSRTTPDHTSVYYVADADVTIILNNGDTKKLTGHATNSVGGEGAAEGIPVRVVKAGADWVGTKISGERKDYDLSDWNNLSQGEQGVAYGALHDALKGI